MSEKLTAEQIQHISRLAEAARFSGSMKVGTYELTALCDLALSAADAEQRGRAAGLAEAVAECEKIIANPKPPLWNYRTTPSPRDWFEFKGRKEAAEDISLNIRALSPSPDHVLVPTFHMGQRVEKVSGSSWRGKIVGTYSTELTPEGYAVESENEPGSVQIYPAKALCAMITEVK